MSGEISVVQVGPGLMPLTSFLLARTCPTAALPTPTLLFPSSSFHTSTLAGDRDIKEEDGAFDCISGNSGNIGNDGCNGFVHEGGPFARVPAAGVLVHLVGGSPPATATRRGDLSHQNGACIIDSQDVRKWVASQMNPVVSSHCACCVSFALR